MNYPRYFVTLIDQSGYYECTDENTVVHHDTDGISEEQDCDIHTLLMLTGVWKEVTKDEALARNKTKGTK